MISASLRSLIPATVLLVVGFALGVHWPGLRGLAIAIVIVMGMGTLAALWGCALALKFKSQSAAPLMQAGMFVLDPHHHRLRAAGPAHRLAPHGGQVQPGRPRWSRRPARDSSARVTWGTPGPACSRSPASSRCSAYSRCAACAGLTID